jgi:nucleoside-diphosphate-sugar epimerase
MSALHVIFGAGPAGTAAANALVKAGNKVRVISRSGIRPPMLAGEAEIAAAEATDPASARRAAEGAAVIYNCLNAPYHQWPELFPALQAGVLSAAIDLKTRLVSLENLYMLGEVDGPITEGLPHAAHTKKGKVRAAMSEALIDAHERGDVEVAIGRASDFYGPMVRDSALGEHVFGCMVEGKPAELTGNPSMPHTYSYIEDVGRALAILGTQDRAYGQIWNLPNAPAVSSAEMVRIAAEVLGVAPRVQVVGKLMLRIAGLFIPAAGEIVEMLYEFEKPFVVNSTKFTSTFGDHSTPIPEGIRATVQWYQAEQHAHKPSAEVSYSAL